MVQVGINIMGPRLWGYDRFQTASGFNNFIMTFTSCIAPDIVLLSGSFDKRSNFFRCRIKWSGILRN